MTKFKIIFSIPARNDIKEAKSWYNSKEKGLSKKLATDIKTTSNAIERNPFFASVRYDNTRVALCKKFPYALHYKIYEEQKIIYISAVYHTSREPLT